jgi:membrane protease YdiL (CAAX protease family)
VNQENLSAPPPAERPVVSAPGVPLHPFFRVLLFLLVGFLILVLVNTVAPGEPPGMPPGTRSALWYALALPGLLLESWLFLRAFHGKSYRALGLWFYRGWGRELAMGVAIGAAVQVAVVGALVATRAVAFHGFARGGTPVLSGILGLAGWMGLAAAFEEILFRGYLFQSMLTGRGPVLGVALFSALFAAVHLWNPEVTLLSTVNTFLSGVLLAVAYLKTRGLWLPIGLHWAWNSAMGPILSLPVSGLEMKPALLRVELAGPRWLTGGAYGPESGAVVSVVCCAAILWLARTRRVSASPATGAVLK